NSNVQLYGCRITGNSSEYAGGGIYSYGSQVTLENCVIDSNSAEAWGGGIYISSSGGIINNCVIDANTAETGSGICVFNYSSIKNSIIVNNSDDGIYFWGSPQANITFCDFYNNPGGNFSGYAPPDIGILSQTNANGDLCDVYYNIFMDPLFYATAGDSAWRLTANSPCIDASDPLSPFDPDSTIADMGAYYFHHELGITQKRQIEIPEEFCLFPAYPNPFNPTTTIRFGLPAASGVSLTIYNIRGERVADLVDGYRLAGYHNVTWEAGGLSSGMYLCRIQAGEFNAIRKVILVK
ncbi:MAG: right-handed parallel beta-helix repeat-containing protein, partial [bacterium]